MYYCPVCEKETERRLHNCGTRTRLLRGHEWMNNDVVNFLATAAGALAAMALNSAKHLPFLGRKTCL
jgi:hypothetical protein